MGVGHALMEEFRVNAGVVESDRMARYPIPRMPDSPRVKSILVEHPTAEGPFGAKGVGEIGRASTPAVANALYNAIGLRVLRLPIRAEEVLAYLREFPPT